MSSNICRGLNSENERCKSSCCTTTCIKCDNIFIIRKKVGSLSIAHSEGIHCDKGDKHFHEQPLDKQVQCLKEYAKYIYHKNPSDGAIIAIVIDKKEFLFDYDITTIDPDIKIFKNTCTKFVGKTITMCATFDYDNETTKINDCNMVGNILENIFYPRLNKVLPSLEQGPKQLSPDYWNRNKRYEYEQKCFTGNPSFDVANYRSYITQLCEENGVYRKVFNTKY